VQQEVDDMVARRPIGVSEDAVVDEVGQRRDGAVQRGLREGPPVRAVENQGEVVRRERAEARVFEDQDPVVEDEARAN
jgi:hypothetical protein